MTLRTTSSSTQLRSPFSDFRTALITGCTTATLLVALSIAPAAARAQNAAPVPDAAPLTDPQTAPPATPPAATPDAAQPANDLTLSNQKPSKQRKQKEDKIVQSKATRQVNKQAKKDNPLLGMDAKLPDKALYDKAEDAIKRGRFDVGRLDLQTLLNTYPESQYMMRAKLAVADSWYREGGTAALTQAKQEYKDFITFFPNAPEAAEAQMRVGDIYFREMDKPDRDYTTTVHAEEEYRLMLQQFPDSTLVPQAQQRLRGVQEVLASRETHIADFYAQREPPNLPGAIARYQTVADTYPLYSHMDDVLIGLGDAYAIEAKMVRASRMPEAGKARLEKIYDDAAADAFRRVVLEHAASPHVEDAKDRLVGMGLPVPTPTAEQLAASTALENSRGQYTLSKRAIGLFMNKADTVTAATLGAPPLEDPAPASAATVVKKAITEFQDAMAPAAAKPAVADTTSAAPAPSVASGVGTPATAPTPSAPLSFEDVPAASAAGTSGAAITNVPQSSPATSTGRTSMGIEIVQPGSGTQAPGTAAAPGTAPATTPTFPSAAYDTTGGVQPVGPVNAAPMAPIEQPDVAPEAINEAAGVKTPPAQTTSPDGKKKPKPAFDKGEESSSKHKPKKGLKKLNPL